MSDDPQAAVAAIVGNAAPVKRNTDAPAYSEEWLALRFAERHADRLRYVADWGKWLEWTGTHWRFDSTLQAYDLARTLCREAAKEPDCIKDASPEAIASARTVAATERMARSDRRLVATIDKWDADPWLLNTPGGAVDLRTGDTSPHRPGDYSTKITAAAPGGDCPLWMAFLRRITNSDGEFMTFLQRIAGYALTGSTREHALFFLYGKGSNGKSVFVGTLAGIMGDYAAVAPMETFVSTAGDRHPTELAGLRGARLVTAQETEKGRRWAEAKVKALTGGDKISARFMRGDFFAFVPAFKLLIGGNHKPGLSGVDEAIRRRMNLIPFLTTIPAAERDLKLADKLKDEWPGILAWAIRGCMQWQAKGLAQPAAVVAATDAYLFEEDTLGQWLEERCEVGKSFDMPAEPAFKNLCGWLESRGMRAWTYPGFRSAMTEREGITIGRGGHRNVAMLFGVKLRAMAAPLRGQDGMIDVSRCPEDEVA